MPEVRTIADIAAERPTVSAFAQRMMFLSKMAQEIADVAIFRAAFAGGDRNLVLASVIRRLQREMEGK